MPQYYTYNDKQLFIDETIKVFAGKQDLILKKYVAETDYHLYDDSKKGLYCNKTENKSNVYYYNIIGALDIETSKALVKGVLRGFTYTVQFVIGGDTVMLVRTWDEYYDIINDLATALKTKVLRNAITAYNKEVTQFNKSLTKGEHKKFKLKYDNVVNNIYIPMYIHNLGHEMSYMYKDMRANHDLKSLDLKFFAVSPHRPLSVKDNIYGIEYRDSAILFNAPLKDLKTNRFRKKVGDLDYDLIRTHKTPLTPDEIEYCINDVLVLKEAIEIRLNEYGDNLATIPQTSTGYVRRDTRNAIKNHGELPTDLKMDYDTFVKLQETYWGGYTHAGVLHVGKTIKNVVSLDEASAYPSVMLADKYPMSRFLFAKPTLNELQNILNDENRCCFLNATFEGLVESFGYEHYISASKCDFLGASPNTIKANTIQANGRLVVSDIPFKLWLTDVDYKIIERCYTWDNMIINEMFESTLDYLPSSLVKEMLVNYGKKTKLKNISSMQDEYARGKANINSMYGMAVTNPLHKELSIDKTGTWEQREYHELIRKEQFKDYDESESRFLYYAWGVWITAYARRNLWEAIFELGFDYKYCDTDSVKFTNYDEHKDWFENYNANVDKKMHQAIDALNAREQARGVIKVDEVDVLPISFSYSEFAPFDIHGIPHPLGYFEMDGEYEEFKTLGAKRYMYRTSKGIGTTVAGCGKKRGKDLRLPDYLEKQAKDNGGSPFDYFNEELTVPEDYTGKLLVTYSQDYWEGEVTDYLGNKAFVSANGYAVLTPCTFNMNVKESFLELVFDRQKGIYESDDNRVDKGLEF